MSTSNEQLQIRSFVLESSSEVKSTLAKIKLLAKKKSLIHLVSYIHNTVLVQNLKRELQKELPHTKIVLLHHQDKNKTIVTLFQLLDDVNVKENEISQEILKELSIDNFKKFSHIQGYRNQLLKRYFTDHLTDLPNLYQLRKDLEQNEEYGLILIKIDNFQVINNLYGFLVGDFVIEFVGNYLKENLKEYGVYRLSGSEFGLSLKQRKGFYEA